MSACSIELARAALIRCPVLLEGDWRPDLHGWRWTGRWQADVPLVGLVMCQTGGSTHWARSSHRSSPDGLEIVLHCMARDAHVWVHCGLGTPSGRAMVQSHTDVLRSPPPTIEEFGGSTGQVLPFARVEGEPPLILSVLLISRTDVRSRRLGLWGIKPDLLGAVAEPWRTVLRFGRTGTWSCSEGTPGAPHS
jgi:hypothetical protein